MLWYVSKTPMEDGSYSNPVSNKISNVYELTDENVNAYCEYNGFVFFEETDDGLVITPNIEKWESWKKEMKSRPKPEPIKTPEEKVYENLADAIRDGVSDSL